MRIVIDLQGAQSTSKSRGIGRYSLAFTKALIRAARHHDIHVALNGMLEDGTRTVIEEIGPLVAKDRLHVWYGLSDVQHVDRRNDPRRLTSELIREHFLSALTPDLVIVSSLFEGAADNAITSVGRAGTLPTAAILYDLIPLRFAGDYLDGVEARRWYSEKAHWLKQCDYLFGISDASIADAVRFLDIPDHRCVNIGAGLAQDFATPANLPESSAAPGDRPYFLYVSGADPRKNHRRLLEAFALLPPSVRREYRLVLAGHMPDLLADELRQMARFTGLDGHECQVLGTVDEPTLLTLYRDCACFVFPSLVEGFGLPILEGMAFGKPVICSNIAVLQEVHGWPAGWFDPEDPADIARVMLEVASSERFRNKLTAHGRRQAKRFTWESCAAKALTFIERTVGPQRSAGTGCDPAAACREMITALRSYPQVRQAGLVDVATAVARTYRPDPRRQLLVDISELVNRDAGTGIQRVVRNILERWLNAPPAGWRVEPVYALPDQPGFRYARRFADRLAGVTGAWRDDDAVEVWNGDIFVALDLQLHILPQQAAVLESWRKRNVLTLGVVYDLLPLEFPQFFRDGWGAAQAEWIETIADLDGTLSISRATAAAMRAWRRDNDRRTACSDKWFHLGADFAKQPEPSGPPQAAAALLHQLDSATTFLMVGTVEPRKGHEQVLLAFESLWKDGVDIKLVIVGGVGWGVDTLVSQLRAHRELDTRLFWLDQADDALLDSLYRRADCLLAASRGEGFGLPIVEAAQYGVPLLLRDIPVFRELAGDHASWFDDRSDPAVIADAVRVWGAARAQARLPNSQDIPLLTWQECADQLLELVLADDWRLRGTS